MLACRWLLPTPACEIVYPLLWALRRRIRQHIVVDSDVANGSFGECEAFQFRGRRIKLERAMFVLRVAFVDLVSKSAYEEEHNGHEQRTIIAACDYNGRGSVGFLVCHVSNQRDVKVSVRIE